MSGQDKVKHMHSRSYLSGLWKEPDTSGLCSTDSGSSANQTCRLSFIQGKWEQQHEYHSATSIVLNDHKSERISTAAWTESS